MNSLIPAARASSIAYWISGRSTRGRISFGTDLVAGRNRVPNPATGKTAFVTLLVIVSPLQTGRNVLQPRNGSGSGSIRASNPLALSGQVAKYNCAQS